MAIIQRMFLTTLQTNWAFIQERNCVTFAPGVPDSVAHASAGPDADRDGRLRPGAALGRPDRRNPSIPHRNVVHQ